MQPVLADHPHRGAQVATKQQLLILYLSNSELASKVVAWTFYDGTQSEAILPDGVTQPPYHSGLAALQDGWRLIQWPQLSSYGDEPYDVNYLPYEYVFEKMVGGQI